MERCDGCLHLESERDGAIKNALEAERKVTALELQNGELLAKVNNLHEMYQGTAVDLEAAKRLNGELKESASRRADAVVEIQEELNEMRKKLDTLARTLLEDPKTTLSPDSYAALDAMIKTYLEKRFCDCPTNGAAMIKGTNLCAECRKPVNGHTGECPEFDERGFCRICGLHR